MSSKRIDAQLASNDVGKTDTRSDSRVTPGPKKCSYCTPSFMLESQPEY